MQELKTWNAIPLKVTIEGEPKEIAALVLEIQGRHTENALYDHDKGIKYVLPEKGDPARYSGGGGG